MSTVITTTGSWPKHDGYISAGGDLLSEVMTVEEAKTCANELQGCLGFTFQARNPDGPVEIFFKDKWDLEPDPMWTSYRLAQNKTPDDGCDASGALTTEAIVLLANVSSEELTFSVIGSKDFPLVECVLKDGSSLCAEPGRMIQLPEGVHFHTVMGDGSEAGMLSTLGKAASRMFSGDSVFLARYTNESGKDAVLRFGTVVPGNIVALKLSDWGGEIIGMSGVYFCGSNGLKIASCFKQSLGAAFFGGESLILQRISGDGVVILQGGGCVLQEELTPERPSIRVDTGCLVAFTNNVNYEIALAGGIKSWMFGGEGIFLATITLKPGVEKATVWLESFPYSKWISRIKSCYRH